MWLTLLCLSSAVGQGVMGAASEQELDDIVSALERNVDLKDPKIISIFNKLDERQKNFLLEIFPTPVGSLSQQQSSSQQQNVSQNKLQSQQVQQPSAPSIQQQEEMNEDYASITYISEGDLPSGEKIGAKNVSQALQILEQIKTRGYVSKDDIESARNKLLHIEMDPANVQNIIDGKSPFEGQDIIDAKNADQVQKRLDDIKSRLQLNYVSQDLVNQAQKALDLAKQGAQSAGKQQQGEQKGLLEKNLLQGDVAPLGTDQNYPDLGPDRNAFLYDPKLLQYRIDRTYLLAEKAKKNSSLDLEDLRELSYYLGDKNVCNDFPGHILWRTWVSDEISRISANKFNEHIKYSKEHQKNLKLQIVDSFNKECRSVIKSDMDRSQKIKQLDELFNATISSPNVKHLGLKEKSFLFLLKKMGRPEFFIKKTKFFNEFWSYCNKAVEEKRRLLSCAAACSVTELDFFKTMSERLDSINKKESSKGEFNAFKKLLPFIQRLDNNKSIDGLKKEVKDKVFQNVMGMNVTPYLSKKDWKDMARMIKDGEKYFNKELQDFEKKAKKELKGQELKGQELSTYQGLSQELNGIQTILGDIKSNPKNKNTFMDKAVASKLLEKSKKIRENLGKPSLFDPDGKVAGGTLIDVETDSSTQEKAGLVKGTKSTLDSTKEELFTNQEKNVRYRNPIATT